VDGGLPFVKGHGTENDFVLLPDLDGRLDLTPALVRALCDRRAGLGADGVLRVVRSVAAPEALAHAGGAEVFMDHRNADGSTAEMCGNGIRVFARYLVAAGLAAPGRVSVATRGGVKDLEVTARGDVTVDMGPPLFVGESVATVDGRAYAGVHVSMGNPHLVCGVDAPLETVDLTRPVLVDREDFPASANVELVRGPLAAVPGSDVHVAMRVHERGVGETRSCGTGACAVAAVALRAAGHATGVVAVDVSGGRLGVRLDGRTAFLTGPAVLVAEGTLDPAWVAAVRSGAPGEPAAVVSGA